MQSETPTDSSENNTQNEKIEELCRPMILSDEQLKRVMQEMHTKMEKGLSDEPGVKSCLKMLPSFVRAIPNGTEKGDYLALDLGGTNFRILLIRLNGTEAEMSGKIYRVPDSIMKGSGIKLFDHIVKCLANFIEENGLKGADKLPLGFTFSFPVLQEGLASGKLIHWTKGFSASDVEGKDVVEFLREACIRRKDIDIDVAAILNDTVGTLMACAFKENSCQIGVILGTGTNACYMEKLSNCPKLKKLKLDEDKYPNEMIINMEWGAFGDDGCLNFVRSSYDMQVDEKTVNPGMQLFEKMISGMYMGELVRHLLVRLAKEKLIFDGDYHSISQPYCFPTKFVSEIEAEQENDAPYQKTMQILEDIGIERVTTQDCSVVAYVCSVVSTRAAHLTAAAITCLLSRLQKPYVTVGIDGSLFRFHPYFAEILDQKINQLLPKNLEYQLMLSEDGSGRGAALVAAVAKRVRRETQSENKSASSILAKKSRINLTFKLDEQFDNQVISGIEKIMIYANHIDDCYLNNH
uniref:Phosphotransferase n=1 Tax=Thelazia callipaeda TaxID=103827 RepID=A0A0N5DBB7_THECL